MPYQSFRFLATSCTAENFCWGSCQCICSLSPHTGAGTTCLCSFKMKLADTKWISLQSLARSHSLTCNITLRSLCPWIICPWPGSATTAWFYSCSSPFSKYLIVKEVEYLLSHYWVSKENFTFLLLTFYTRLNHMVAYTKYKLIAAKKNQKIFY